MLYSYNSINLHMKFLLMNSSTYKVLSFPNEIKSGQELNVMFVQIEKYASHYLVV